MNLQQVIGASQDVLARIGFSGWPLDVRTIRYYSTKRIIPKPGKNGKLASYNTKHVEAIILVKVLQSQGLSLDAIQQRINQGTELEPSISKIVGEIVSSIEPVETNEGEEEMSKHKVSKKRVMAPRGTRPRPKPKTFSGNSEGVLKVEMSDHADYAAMQPHVSLGSAFAFVDGVEGDLATKIHRLLYGQKSGGGQVERAVLHVDESGLVLPGVTLTGKSAIGDGIKAIIPDKGVYEEGDGVASLFVFDPANANKKIAVVVSLDGAPLDRIETDLDGNGCALVRVSTLVSGGYSASIEGTNTSCSFDATRYELAAFVVTVTAIEKAKDGIAITAEAETYGEPYEGTARLTVASINKECKFHEGIAKFTMDLGDLDGELSLQVVDKEDAVLATSAPLTGTKKHERSATDICSMGRVTSVSMIRTPQAISERGLFFEEGAYTNSPISVKSCISKDVALTLAVDVEDLVVVVKDPISGKSFVEELGDHDKGDTVSVKFDFPFAMVHVGAFVGDEAWEGHAVVVKPSEGAVEVSAPAQADPGSTVKIRLKSKGLSSVLLKVCDRRVKSHYEPMSAIASSAKAWLAWALSGKATGTAAGALENQIYTKGGILRGIHGSGHLLTGALGARGLTDQGGVSGMYGTTDWVELAAASSYEPHRMIPRSDADAPRYMMSMSVANDDRFTASVSSSRNKNIENIDRSSVTLADGGFLTPTAHAIFVNAGPSIVEPVRSKKEAKARETTVDLVYCDLIEVDGERTVEVKLPDSIALYDIKAFSVKGINWAETATAIRAEKNMYIEPLVPRIAHPEDGIKCRAVFVKAPTGYTWAVKVNGKPANYESKIVGENTHVQWDAVPGSHDISLVAPDGETVDRVMRVVEAPGEEIVLAQEMRILRKGKYFDVTEEDALSVVVLPGMESELSIAVQVTADFQYSCCEQTSAKIAAAALAIFTGDDSSRAKGFESIIKGEARMRSMYNAGKGFSYYPGDSVHEWASKCAANRIMYLCDLLGDKYPSDVKKSIKSLKDMSANVVKVHGVGGYDMEGKMAGAYYDKKKVAEADAIQALESLKPTGYCSSKSEAAYAVASLIRQGVLEAGIDGANKVAKAMQGTMGGGWHGTCESLAYMYMVYELTKAGIVPGVDGEVRVDGKKSTIDAATKMRDVSRVEATKGAVAVRISRLERIDLGAANSTVPISVDVVAADGSRDLRPGRTAKLKVKLAGGYQQGDVLCVVLPDCLSRIVGGAKAKKFQADFSGKSEIEIDVVAHGTTDKPQRFAAVVRNMYDSSRIGSVGLMTTTVGK